LDGLYQELIERLLNTSIQDGSGDGDGKEEEEQEQVDGNDRMWESIVEDTSPVSEWDRRLGTMLREKRLSMDTMMQLVERLYERQIQAEKRIRILMDGTTVVVGDNGTTPMTITNLTTNGNDDNVVGRFNIGDRSNSREYLEKEFYVLQWFLDRVLGAQALLDEEPNNVMGGLGVGGGGGGGGRRTSGSTKSKSGSSHSSSIRGVASALEARLRELKRAQEQEFQRTIALKLNDRSGSIVGDGVQSLVSETKGVGERNVTIKIDGREISGSKVNITRLMEDIVQVPMWVPSSILPFLVVYRKELDVDDLKKIKKQVLSGSQFRVDNWDFTRMAAVYRGSFVDNRRGSMYKTIPVGRREEMKQRRLLTESSFQDIQKRLGEAGLADRIQLFLMEDPEWRPGSSRDPEPLPAILAVSSDVKPEQVSERGKATKFFTVSCFCTLF
jgi:hypothetical protein